MIPTTILLASLLSGTPAAAEKQAPRREASLVRAYDLRPALPGPMRRGGVEGLLPYLRGNDRGEQEEIDPLHGADSLIDLLRTISGEDWDYEDRAIQVEERGRMIVRAPQAVQARTETYLAFLERVFGASLELRIDAVELPEGAASEPVASALLAPAAADELIARGNRSAGRTWRLRLRAGETAALDMTRVASLVTDYDVEIAQASAIADPIVDEVSVGTRLAARAAPAAGGTWLSLILRRGDPLGEFQDRQLPLAASVNTTERLVQRETARTYQTVDVLNRSLALDTYLPENRVLAIQSSIVSGASGGAMRTEVLLVRRESGSLPIFEQAALGAPAEGGPGKVAFLNAESVAPPRVELETQALPDDRLPYSWRMWKHRNADDVMGVWAWFANEGHDVLRDQIASVVGEVDIRDVGPCLFLSRPASSPQRDAALLPGRDGAAPDVLTALTPAARLVQVTATLRRSGQAAPIARSSIPVRIGESGCAILGTERFELGDYDVEVAQGASTADAIIRLAFDGVALRVRPTVALSGDLVLDLTARAHVRRGERRELDLGVDGLGPIDESTHDQLFVRESLRFGKSENAPKRFVLGESSGGVGSMALEIEAVDLK